jgi:hypothetical protein
MKIEKHTVVPESYSKGRNLNRRIKRQNNKLDEQFAEARKHWWDKTQPVPDPVIVLHCDIDAQKLEVPHTMMRAYVGNRQARIVGSFDVVPDVLIESDQDE